MQSVAFMARVCTGAPLSFAATSKALRAGGVAGAEEPGAEHGAASKGPGAGVDERANGAVETSGRPPLSAVKSFRFPERANHFICLVIW